MRIDVQAVSEDWHIACTSGKAQKDLIHIAGAGAKGSFAINARRIVATAEANAVAVNKAPLSIPVTLSMDGFTAKM